MYSLRCAHKSGGDRQKQSSLSHESVPFLAWRWRLAVARLARRVPQEPLSVPVPARTHDTAPPRASLRRTRVPPIIENL